MDELIKAFYENANTMKAIDYLMDLNTVCCFHSRERTGKASNSEMRRWFNNHSIIINGAKPLPNDMITFPVTSLVLFSKGKRVTII